MIVIKASIWRTLILIGLWWHQFIILVWPHWTICSSDYYMIIRLCTWLNEDLWNGCYVNDLVTENIESSIMVDKVCMCSHCDRYIICFNNWTINLSVYRWFERVSWAWRLFSHYWDVIMSAMASQITSVSIVCSTVCSDGDQRKHQSSASLAFVRGIHRWSVNSPHKGPVTRKMFPLDDVIMSANCGICTTVPYHNHRQFDCLFNSLLELLSKRAPKPNIIGFLWVESNGDWWLPLTKSQ